MIISFSYLGIFYPYGAQYNFAQYLLNLKKTNRIVSHCTNCSGPKTNTISFDYYIKLSILMWSIK